MTVIALTSAAVLALSSAAIGQMLPWNNTGLATTPNQPPDPAAARPAPSRDLSGAWDAGGAGIGARGHMTSPLTPFGEEMSKRNKSGDGARMVSIPEINDPLSTMADPGGFPRQLLFELRPFQVVQTPNQVLMLYMWEKRWRVIWTDGRQLPKDPDPRWYGYSVGRWEDDSTLVVNTVGMDERTWLDNSGNPHSDQMRVEERYHRVNAGTVELTVTIDDPKVYTKPWVPRNRMVLRLLPADTDLMEMIPSASEVAAYRRIMGGSGR
ncbi:MAG: hypothetical protein EXQ53_07350 [Acidobacteria bacterium]|nr:hypothetical protein [Acidobacteriota bacterium]